MSMTAIDDIMSPTLKNGHPYSVTKITWNGKKSFSKIKIKYGT